MFIYMNICIHIIYVYEYMNTIRVCVYVCVCNLAMKNTCEKNHKIASDGFGLIYKLCLSNHLLLFCTSVFLGRIVFMYSELSTVLNFKKGY